jgi:hypothetical protein
LRHLADDDGAGRVGETLQLVQVLAQIGSRATALERRSNEKRPLDRLLNLDWLLCDLLLRDATGTWCCTDPTS